MGQKVHPYGFRLGGIRQARSRWFAEGDKYRQQLIEDIKIREYIQDTHRNAGISDIIIERAADTITVTIATAKPGIIIGRGGRDVDRLRGRVEELAEGRVRINVEETPQPDINAQLVAENIAHEIERRISPRRAMGQAIERAMNMGAEGARCQVSGRIRGAEIARTETAGPEGRVPLHTLRADVDYGFAEAMTSYGPVGVKAWIYKGEILPPQKEEGPQPEPAEEEVQVLQATSGSATPSAVVRSAVGEEPEQEPEEVVVAGEDDKEVEPAEMPSAQQPEPEPEQEPEEVAVAGEDDEEVESAEMPSAQQPEPEPETVASDADSEQSEPVVAELVADWATDADGEDEEEDSNVDAETTEAP